MLQNKPKDFIFFVFILTILNFMGPGALFLSVPVFLYKDKLEFKLLLSAIMTAGAIIFFISMVYATESVVLTYYMLHFFILTVPFLYFIENPYNRIFKTLMLVMIVSFLTILSHQLITGVSLLQKSIEILNEGTNEIPKELIDSMKVFEKIVPGIVSIFEGGIFLLNIYIFSKIKKVDIGFENFKLSEFLLPVFIFVAIIYIVTTFTGSKGYYIGVISLNLIIVLLFFYFLSGFSLLVFGMRLVKTPMLLRIFIFLTPFTHAGLILITALGFADFWLDFRKKLLNKYIK